MQGPTVVADQQGPWEALAAVVQVLERAAESAPTVERQRLQGVAMRAVAVQAVVALGLVGQAEPIVEVLVAALASVRLAEAEPIAAGVPEEASSAALAAVVPIVEVRPAEPIAAVQAELQQT